MGVYTFPDTIQTSSAFKYLVSSTLQKDPSKRPSIKELKNLDFFKGPSLSRKPSMCLKNQTSLSITKDEK